MRLIQIAIGNVDPTVGGQLFNCAAVVHGGEILAFVPKEKLPTYNVFYEARTFSRGGPGLALDAGGVAMALRSLFPGHDPERLAAWAARFATLFTRSIYKWVQSPLSLHVGSLDLDRERALQLPVVQRNEWSGGSGRRRGA